MLETALSMVSESGLTVSLDHLSLETVIARAEVSRASAYRRWPFKDLFLADLLVAVAQDTELSAEPPGLVRELTALIEATDLSDAQSRRDLLVEALRISSEAEFERLRTSPRWRTYLALSATITGLPEGRIRDTAAAAVHDAERRFASRREGVYRHLAQMIGYRPRRDMDPSVCFELMSHTSGAAMTGFIVKSLVTVPDRSFEIAPFGAGGSAQWSIPVYGLTAIFDAFLEPDPDASWSGEAIAERRALWDATAAELYGL